MTSSYEPSPWADFFIGYEPTTKSSDHERMTARVAELKAEVSELFMNCRSESPTSSLELVDAVQRLGVDHHFQEEIHAALGEIHGSESSGTSLREAALRFRLLREHGHWVSLDVFDRFRGGEEDGRFVVDDIKDDPRALLSLHDASHLLVDGESALEEAIAFARRHLELINGGGGGGLLQPPLAEQVQRSLRTPLPRTFTRVEAMHFIAEYPEDPEGRHCRALLELAKLDFNLLQHLYLKELRAITEWWNGVRARIELSYARDRAVECYTWSYTVFYEEGFAHVRMIITKVMLLMTVMDDTYDNHATIEECQQLTQAMQRWDGSAVSLLPEYLKKFYSQLLRIFEEFKSEMAASDRHRISYLKRQNVPSLCVCFMAIGAGHGVPKEAPEWAAALPDVVMATARIARFMNDIASLKRGKCKGDGANSVECYMNEKGVTSEVAVAEIDSLVGDAWRTTNRARFGDRAMLPAVTRVINFAVSMTFFYDDRTDAFTFCDLLKKNIDALFVQPISM